jgi:hypothetical protein
MNNIFCADNNKDIIDQMDFKFEARNPKLETISNDRNSKF